MTSDTTGIRATPDLLLTPGGGRSQVWRVPPEQQQLQAILTWIFETHWQSIIFGPLIEGAAYEFRCPCAPYSISLFDGYLTVRFGGTHFHLCIGNNFGSPQHPVRPTLTRQRRPSRAEFFRSLDHQGCPVSWGFRMFNGHGEPQISIFFPNPFLTDEDGIAERPNWERLAVWESVARQFLRREPEQFDRSGQGFAHG